MERRKTESMCVYVYKRESLQLLKLTDDRYLRLRVGVEWSKTLWIISSFKALSMKKGKHVKSKDQ